jgi:hypothetical protein
MADYAFGSIRPKRPAKSLARKNQIQKSASSAGTVTNFQMRGWFVRLCRVFPGKQTSVGKVGMSADGQQRKSFDHFIRARDQQRRRLEDPVGASLMLVEEPTY